MQPINGRRPERRIGTDAETCTPVTPSPPTAMLLPTVSFCIAASCLADDTVERPVEQGDSGQDSGPKWVIVPV